MNSRTNNLYPALSTSSVVQRRSQNNDQKPSNIGSNENANAIDVSVVQRRIQNRDEQDSNMDRSGISNATDMTLKEEVLLLALKDREGYVSFWNENISSVLRGCILIELALHQKIMLELPKVDRRKLIERKIIINQSSPTGDALLDEALHHIKNTQSSENVLNWVTYLNGDSLNPFKLRYQLKNVRERLAKSLVEKGVLTNSKRDFVLFDMNTHPVQNTAAKDCLVKQIQEAVLNRWPGDIHRMDKRLISLIIMAFASDSLQNVLGPLNTQDYKLAIKRVRTILALNLETERLKSVSQCTDVVWAVFTMFAQ
ncbi:golgi phosphoprotein 3 (GPP34) domain-containing protein [Ditylenchus destructor]|uniref:Golgi phosphoprotein 3 (GPP34) domain-containing protein n=1 Tax=Ditylenchus destructor TaxID=166010 RepID=A0AAD4N114_9BILA|nr:golgi phosphoprotein 3 (GPP34) domain-containing protein [Ditylenchus destructor]